MFLVPFSFHGVGVSVRGGVFVKETEPLPSPVATEGDGTHPTGMHTCFITDRHMKCTLFLEMIRVFAQVYGIVVPPLLDT